MKAVIVTPKDRAEMEDIGLGIMMKEADRSRKVSRESVIRKLKS